MNDLPLIAEPDLHWISDVIDVVERCARQPWRDALDRLADLQRATQPVTPRRFNAVVSAIQRVSAGRARNARAAREARSLVLGRPVLGPVERRARIAAAAERLAIPAAAVETLLWADLPRERPVELPGGRPSERDVAALANVSLIQRALRHAQSVKLWLADSSGAIFRAAARRGLLTSASIAAHGETCIEIVGPLTLLHRTQVYARALADLVPLLGNERQFVLEIYSERETSSYTTTITSPVLLPPPRLQLGALPYPLAKLPQQLGRLVPELVITIAPPLVRAGTSLLCPDMLLERAGRRHYVELVPLWTDDYLRRRLAAYAGTEADVILCIDSAGRSDRGVEPTLAGILRYTRRVDPKQVLEHIEPPHVVERGAPTGR